MSRTSPNGPVVKGAVIQAEMALLAALLREPGRIADARGLVAAADFYSDAHQRTYAVLLDLAAGGGPVDVVTVADELARRGWLEVVGGYPFVGDVAGAFGSPAAL